MAREVVVKCSIPREDYDTVIGLGGGNVYALGIEHSVSILLPGVPFLAIQPPGAHRVMSQIPGYEEASPLEGNPDSRNVDILIRGKAENCQRAKKDILGLLPVVTEAVIVPYRFRNAILGPQHENIETISDQYGVRIEFPPLLLESEFVHIVGPKANCSKASDALVKRVRELKIEEGKNLLKQRETIKLASECHNHIIRSRLATMAKIREEHDVEIFFNYKENLDLHIHEVVIIGLERQTRAAKEKISQIVKELETYKSREVNINHRVRDHIFRPRGMAIAKVEDHFDVLVHFPLDEKSNNITVTGKERNVENAIDHLLMLADCLPAVLPTYGSMRKPCHY